MHNKASAMLRSAAWRPIAAAKLLALTAAAVIIMGTLEVTAHTDSDDVQEKATFSSAQNRLFDQIAEDLKTFASGISLQQVERAFCAGGGESGGFRLQVFGGRMYVIGEQRGIQWRNRDTKLQLLRVAGSVKLPDLDIGWINTGDVPPPADKGFSEACPQPGPVFVMAKTEAHHNSILYPDFTFLDWVDAHAVPWADMPAAMSHAAARPWDGRSSQLFARAHPIGPTRDVILRHDKVTAGHNLMNVSITDWHAHPETFVSLTDHCNFKWLLHTAGNTYSARLKYLLLCGSAVVLPRNAWSEFYTEALEDGVHVYKIPSIVESGHVHHVVQAAEALYNNDATARHIGGQGRSFAQDMINPAMVQAYWVRLLKEYAALQSFLLAAPHPHAVPLETSLLHDTFDDMPGGPCQWCISQNTGDLSIG